MSIDNPEKPMVEQSPNNEDARAAIKVIGEALRNDLESNFEGVTQIKI